jgi:UDP-arabinose 4-epimerase
VALRYFNACGADLDGEIGEEHNPETHLIPRALMAASGELACLDIYGDDYDTPDGTCIRDYIHVWDLARGHSDALAYLYRGGDSCSANLGSGVGISVKQIVDSASRITGQRIPMRIGPRRRGDPAVLLANPNLAQAKFGFTTQHSDIECIVATAWKFSQSKKHSRSRF